MRKPIERTTTITVDMYSLLFDCCENYYDSIAWRFPEECPDGAGCCGLDLQKFSIHMKFEIPSLFRGVHERIAKPLNNPYMQTDYDQFALLDLVEFIGQNCRDIEKGSFHSYFDHFHLKLLDTSEVAATFRDEINGIFQMTGLLFMLTEKMMVERILEDSDLTSQVETVVQSVKEKGLKDLLEEAIALFRQPDPAYRSDAVEKLWDAFERLKTYYTTLDKRASAEKIVEDMGQGQALFKQLFNDEFVALTTIGNKFRIRHHETNTIDIQDIRHYDYLFNRCLSLIAAAAQYLQ